MIWRYFYPCALSSSQETIDPTLENTVLMFIDQNCMREIMIIEWKTVMMLPLFCKYGAENKYML